MVKLICPHCMKPVPVPDDFSGGEVTCPGCGKSFDAPARYNPEVIAEPRPEPPAPPPVPAALPPEPPPVPVAPAPHPAPPGLVVPPPVPPTPVPQPAGGYTRSAGFTVSPRVVAWLPPVLLTITFLCTFLPWVGSYVGNTAVYSQNIWRAMFGYVKVNYAVEPSFDMPRTWLEAENGKLVRADWDLLIPFVLCLVLAALIAWADRGLGHFDPKHIPPLARVWPWRKTVIAVLGGLALLFVMAEGLRGFSMQRAMRAGVGLDPKIAKEREEAAGNQAKLDKLAYRETAELAKYNIEHTFWHELGVVCNLFAVLAVLLSIVLDKRGNKPPPKLLLHY